MNLGNYINKIMVDSRFKSINSTSNTDFKIELPDNLQMPPYTGCVITDDVIPRTFYKVTKLKLQRLYNNSYTSTIFFLV